MDVAAATNPDQVAVSTYDGSAVTVGGVGMVPYISPALVKLHCDKSHGSGWRGTLCSSS
jgi:hypothetical protein